ncbi:L-aspartate oxidase [Candidatus Viridilinea mediisalina]|uniref:L-aspartate oxidase n=1 Tax=Candidatus Viridilinea mediisalina TaxID=2024553 RepID=A0A2A6RKK2_9CHLR|nr:L-aspartate oxidase [Candidatus Viridilinea mediisalina]PDW03473.1 L-aspartate oxidase [Candidatus Viridilinea mediisalina]
MLSPHAPRYALDPLPQPVTTRSSTILVLGAGAAGLSAALAAAASADVFVLARGDLPASNSALAQGGIAAALDPSDTPAAHIADTLIAGAGLCDEAAVTTLAYSAPALMRELAAAGVPFARHGNDQFALGLEGGHATRRILHVGDATGLAVTGMLLAAAQAHPRITLLAGWQAADLLDANGQIIGLLARAPDGQWHHLLAQATIIASGGAGALYGLTSNQPTALGEGIAMAYRAGAEVADMEFIQFHPTVYQTQSGAGFLISEATRGEGAILRTPAGGRFMPAYDPRAELAPRDIVTRGIYAAMSRAASDHVLLDLTHLPRTVIEAHFPTICARLRSEGLDPATKPIPVAPAAHYLMGGIRTNLDGATNLPGLFAAGEAACTGVHGANRLASNSLLECLVFGRRAGLAALHTTQALPKPKLHSTSAPHPSLQPPTAWREQLAALMHHAAGPLRDGANLRAGSETLSPWPLQASPEHPEYLTAANATLVARMILTAALYRQESRGGHFRSDFPQAHTHWQQHSILRNGRKASRVHLLHPDPTLAHAAD